MNRMLPVLVLLFLLPASAGQIPQGVFTEAFPPEEFAARRAAVINSIGDAVAIIQGAVEKPAELPFRQALQQENMKQSNFVMATRNDLAARVF